MNDHLIIKQTAAYVREKLSGEGSGHDWWHVFRVWQNAIEIANHENADLFIIELAALLHDIDDWKFNGGCIMAGPKAAGQWLRNLQVSSGVILHVCDIIATMSFKGAGVKSYMTTIEGMIVQDADRIDAIGAIGIARTFAYGGFKGREIYNPTRKPENHETFEQYKKGSGTTINHFYEKLLLVKDLLNTHTAKEMARERHQFLEIFLQQFLNEWPLADDQFVGEINFADEESHLPSASHLFFRLDEQVIL